MPQGSPCVPPWGLKLRPWPETPFAGGRDCGSHLPSRRSAGEFSVPRPVRRRGARSARRPPTARFAAPSRLAVRADGCVADPRRRAVERCVLWRSTPLLTEMTATPSDRYDGRHGRSVREMTPSPGGRWRFTERRRVAAGHPSGRADPRAAGSLRDLADPSDPARVVRMGQRLRRHPARCGREGAGMRERPGRAAPAPRVRRAPPLRVIPRAPSPG